MPWNEKREKKLDGYLFGNCILFYKYAASYNTLVFLSGPTSIFTTVPN